MSILKDNSTWLDLICSDEPLLVFSSKVALGCTCPALGLSSIFVAAICDFEVRFVTDSCQHMSSLEKKLYDILHTIGHHILERPARCVPFIGHLEHPLMRRVVDFEL